MVRTRQPEGIIALHPLGSDNDVLQRKIERMPDMQHPGYVRRRDHNREWFGIRLATGFEIFAFLPIGVPFLFRRLRIICGRHGQLFLIL